MQAGLSLRQRPAPVSSHVPINQPINYPITNQLPEFQHAAGCVQGSAGFCISMTPYPWLFLTN